MKRPSKIPLSPLRKRMDAVVDEVVDGLEQRTLVEGTREYLDGICIKEREFHDIKVNNNREIKQTRIDIDEKAREVKEKGDLVLEKTINEMEVMLNDEKRSIIGLDNEINTLKDEKVSLNKRLQELIKVVDGKTDNFKRELSREETKLAVSLESQLKEFEWSIDELKSDLSQIGNKEGELNIEISNKMGNINSLELELQSLITSNEIRRDSLFKLKERKVDIEMDLAKVKGIKTSEDKDYHEAESNWQRAKEMYEHERTQRESIEAQIEKLNN